jgi:dTDP-4-dehydrorhamnose reductase
VVNAAAYTAVDRAESEVELCYSVNAQAPGALARASRRVGALFVHYSTDYVFDGEVASPYDEASPTHPVSVYGASKLAGEHAIAATGALALTLRTSWVYSRHGQNFLVTMQKLAATRDELRVVDDQVGVPNWSRWIATVTAGVVARGAAYVAQRAGLYHLSAHGSATWCDFARAILGDREHPRVTPITTADYPTPARRPKYAVLDASRFARTFDVALPDWRNLLHECLDAPVEPPRLAAVD